MAIDTLLKQQKAASKDSSLVQTATKATQKVSADDFDKFDSSSNQAQVQVATQVNSQT